MEDELMEKLHKYIRDNNPDVFMALQEESRLTGYINDKVSSMSALIQQRQKEGNSNYIIEEECFALMTEDLRPSKFHYINNIFQEAFEAKWLELNTNGLLRYEVINIIDTCETVFQEMNFTEDSEDDQQLRNAIIGTIAGYLETH